MERVVNKAKTFQEAEEWDIIQHLSMTPEQRHNIARELKRRVYAEHVADVRESHHKQ